MKAVAAALAALVAGCAGQHEKIITESECLRSHVNMELIFIPQTTCINNVCNTTLQQHWYPVTHCEQELRIVRPNPNYKAAT